MYLEGLTQRLTIQKIYWLFNFKFKNHPKYMMYFKGCDLSKKVSFTEYTEAINNMILARYEI